jgi:dihydrofolate reductase
MQQDLIDGFWLFVNPIILGQGIPLFKDIKNTIKLKLLPTTRQFSCGVTELNYELDKTWKITITLVLVGTSLRQ